MEKLISYAIRNHRLIVILILLLNPNIYPLVAKIEPHIHTPYDDFNPSIKVEKGFLLEDIGHYIRLVNEVHGNPYQMISKESFLTKAEKIKKEIFDLDEDSIPLIDCYYFIQELSASIKDGHTKIDRPWKWDEYIDSVFPLLFVNINDTLLVSENLGCNGIPINAEVLAINNTSVSEIKLKTIKYISGTLDQYKNAKWAEDFWYLIQTNLQIGSPWLIEYKYSGNVFEKTISGISWKERGERFPQKNNKYSYEIVKINRKPVPVLKIPSFGIGSFEDYKEFLNKFFKKYSKKKYLIVDIRENEGGEGVWARYLLDFFTDSTYEAFNRFESKMSPEYIEVIQYFLHSYYNDLKIPEDQWDQNKYGASPYEYFFDNALKAKPNSYEQLREKKHVPHTTPYKFEGQVLLLTSNKTFSAGIVFAALFQELNLDIILGNKTGDRTRFCSDPITIELPNSHLRAIIPVAELILQRNYSDQPVIPDIEVHYEVKDYIENKDLFLWKAIEIISKDMGKE